MANRRIDTKFGYALSFFNFLGKRRALGLVGCRGTELKVRSNNAEGTSTFDGVERTVTSGLETASMTTTDTLVTVS